MFSFPRIARGFLVRLAALCVVCPTALAACTVFGGTDDASSESAAIGGMSFDRWYENVTGTDLKRLRMSAGLNSADFVRSLDLFGRHIDSRTLENLEGFQDGLARTISDCVANTDYMTDERLGRLKGVYEARYRTTHLLPIPFRPDPNRPLNLWPTFTRREIQDLRIFYRPEGTTLLQDNRGTGSIPDARILPLSTFGSALGVSQPTVREWQVADDGSNADEALQIVSAAVVKRLGMLQHLRASIYAAVNGTEASRAKAIGDAESLRAWLVQAIFARRTETRWALEHVYWSFHEGERRKEFLIDYRDAMPNSPYSPAEVLEAGPAFNAFFGARLQRPAFVSRISARRSIAGAIEALLPNPADPHEPVPFIDDERAKFEAWRDSVTGNDLLRLRMSLGYSRPEFVFGLGVTVDELARTMENRRGDRLYLEYPRNIDPTFLARRDHDLAVIYKYRVSSIRVKPIPIVIEGNVMGSAGSVKTFRRRDILDLLIFYHPAGTESESRVATNLPEWPKILPQLQMIGILNIDPHPFYDLRILNGGLERLGVLELGLEAQQRLGMLEHMRAALYRSIEQAPDGPEKDRAIRKARAVRRQLVDMILLEKMPLPFIYHTFEYSGIALPPIDDSYPESAGIPRETMGSSPYFDPPIDA